MMDDRMLVLVIVRKSNNVWQPNIVHRAYSKYTYQPNYFKDND